MTFPYVWATADAARGHPLTTRGGPRLLEHRRVLYDKLGPGPHSCHWCGAEVHWTSGRGPRTGNELVVDHIDRDNGNNAPENLVPACNACNATRTKNRRASRRVLRAELWRKEERGASWWLLALACGHEVVRRKQPPSRAWCATCAGGAEPPRPERRVGLGQAAASAVVPAGGYQQKGRVQSVVKEISMSTRPRGYRYRYLLACGHEVERNGANKQWCRCEACPA